jgi:hypothetical protein
MAEEREREMKSIVNYIFFFIISVWCLISLYLIIDIYKNYV